MDKNEQIKDDVVENSSDAKATKKAIAEQQKELSDKLARADALLERLEKAEQAQTDASAKKDNTKPIPLTSKSLAAYIADLKMRKPHIYAKKEIELTEKLAKLKSQGK